MRKNLIPLISLLSALSTLLMIFSSISYAAPTATAKQDHELTHHKIKVKITKDNYTNQQHPLYIATASNFLSTLRKITKAYENKYPNRIHDHNKIIISSGSTGELYAQIINGAPFDLFFSADTFRPKKLEQQHLIKSNSRYTYALGQLVFWHPGHTLKNSTNSKPNPNALQNILTQNFAHVAIANPQIAPYGLAAKQVLTHLHKWQSFLPHLVYGENINQTFTLVETNNAEAGFVALSQIMALEKKNKKTNQPIHDNVMQSFYRIPQADYQPIKQQMVLLKNASANQEATEFYHFIKSETVKKIIEASGYKVPVRH